jgi:hypothetical protein
MISTSRETGDTPAVDGDGNVAPVADDGYVTLEVDVHYFILGGAKGAHTLSAQIVTDALIAGTLTVEVSNLPRDPINGPAEIADNDETTGNWVQFNPPDDAVGWAFGVGAGWVITELSLVKAAGLGGAIVTIPNLGFRRARLRADITTPGRVRVNAHAKS